MGRDSSDLGRKPLARKLKGRQWWIAAFWTVATGLILSAQFSSLAKVPEIVREAEWKSFAVFCIMYLLFVFLRGVRFRLFIDPRSPLLHGTLVSTVYTASCMLAPGGLGELSLPVTYLRTRGIPVSVSVAALLVTRVYDIVSVLAVFLAVLALGTVQAIPASLTRIIWLCGVASAMLSASLLVPALRRPGLRGLRARVGDSPLYQFFLNVDQALGSTPISVLCTAMWQTGLLRLAALGMYVFLLYSFGLDLSALQVAAAAALNSLFLAIPVQGIAGFGTQEAWWTLSLGLVGVSPGVALAYAVGVHLVLLTISTLLGAAAAGALLCRRNSIEPEGASP